MRDTRTACPILMYDTLKDRRISCRFQICSQKYQFPHSKKVDFFALCKFMQIRRLYSRYGFQGCGTAQGRNLPSMVCMALIVQFLWEIASSYGKVVFGPTFEDTYDSRSVLAGRSSGQELGLLWLLHPQSQQAVIWFVSLGHSPIITLSLMSSAYRN